MKYFNLLFITLYITACSSGNLRTEKFKADLSDIAEGLTEEAPLKSDKAKVTPFINKSQYYGLEGIKASTINVVDLNSDGYSDLVILPSFYSLPEFYFYIPSKHVFKKQTSLMDKPERMSFMIFHDFNKDGVIDFLTGVLNEETELSKKPLKIFYGEEDKKKEILFKRSLDLGSVGPTASVGLIDVNIDGHMDLYVGNWFTQYRQTKIPVSDKLLVWSDSRYLNLTSEYLEKELQTNLSGSMETYATPTYGVQICDVDSNGYPDVITTSTNRFHNKLWMNQYRFREKKRIFRDFGVESGVAGDPDGLINKQGSGRSFGLACTDYNHDSIIDIYLGELTHNYDDQSIDRSSLLTGRSLKFPPRFFRTEYFLDSYDFNWQQADRRGIWVDLNNDGLLDLIVDNSGYPPQTKMLAFIQEGDHAFTEKGKDLGLDFTNPISTVLIDINKDGKMDLLTARSKIRDDSLKNELILFENNWEHQNKSIRFYLKGKKANSQGLGGSLVLKINTSKGVEYRKQAVSYSYGAFTPQNEDGVLFGIKENEVPLEIVAIWPYNKKANVGRASLEKVYKIPSISGKSVSYDLFENGKIKKH